MKIFFSFLAILLISTASAQAADIKINQKFSGATHPTMIDSDDDGVHASAGSYQIFGSPGRSTAEGFAEFSAFEFTGAPGCELRAEMVTESFVETFNDGSMLFNWVTEGFNCVDLATGEIGGELIGIITGGTGRFAGASGEFMVDFNAKAATEVQNVFYGTITGVITLPE